MKRVIRPYQRLFVYGAALMFCIPHTLWNNWYAAVFAALALVWYLWDCAAHKRAPQSPALLGVGVWVFLLMCLLCSLWARSPRGNLRTAAFYFTGFTLSYLAAAFRNRRALDALLAALWGALVFTAVYGLIVYISRSGLATVPIDGVEIARLGSTLCNGINYGEFAAMLLPVALIWALQRPEPGQRAVLTGLLALPFAALLLTYSRTGWVMFCIAMLVLVLLLNRRLLLPAAAAGTVGALFLPRTVRSRLLTMLDFSDASSSGRFTLWRECLALWRENRLVGIGLGPENFFHAYLPFSTHTLPFDPPHSNMLYLEMALSLGIVGFLAFLILFFGIFPRLGAAMRQSRDDRGRQFRAALSASLAGAAVGAIPEHIWFYPRVFFCWCILYGLALGQTPETAA